MNSKYDTITYKGKDYPVRLFKVHHNEMSLPTDTTIYTIAPESLLDAMRGEDEYIDWREDQGLEESIDNQVYHYIDDEVFFNSAEDICANHLDIPMVLEEEIFN